MGVIQIPFSSFSNHPMSGCGTVNWTASAEKVSDDVLVVHNSIPGLGLLVDLAEANADRFSQATVVKYDLSHAPDETHRKSERLSLSDRNGPVDLLYYGLMLESMEARFTTLYMEMVNTHAVVHACSGFDLLRYRQGGFFNEHVDVMRDHPVLGHRRLSFVLFCNDGFDGGELVFPRQGLTIKPKTGDLVLFPSNFTHPHASKPIIKGTKYSIVAWFF